VMTHGYVTTPSGRQFEFPNTRRLPSGKITNFTMVKNYPVQSFAADIVQTTLLLLERNMRLKNLKSILVNSVHDSAVIDVYPNEEATVVKTVEETIEQLPSTIFARFNVALDVPLVLEPKSGKNWMIMENIA
jgi:DNA polymerase I-like protein with 3'-5' exonuclease and polymerase domains